MANQLKAILSDKQAFRKKLASKPIAEKLWMLESLSERSLALRPDSSVTVPDDPWPIPSGWRWSRMGDVAAVIGGSTPRTDRPEYFGGDIPWITPADLSKYTGKTISHGSRNISKEGLENSGARLLPAGAVLFSTRAPIGYVAIASIPVATNQGFKSFVLNDEVIADYVFYYLQHARQLAIQMASGTTFLELSGKKAAQIPIPVPPLPQQRCIVTEIEKQFSRLEEGVAALKRVQANLKRYRAAVLKAACEGRLVPTEAELALASGKTFETGEQLLTRILAERRQKWQGRGKYKEPAVPDTSRQPKLPDGWTWARIGQLFECIVPNRDKPRTFTGEIPWITLPDFSEATTIGTGSRKIGLSKAEVEEYNARVIPSGSVVMSCIGRFGLAAKIAQDSVINQQLHAFVIPPFLPAEYFVYALRAGKTYMESIATSTTIAYLNKDNCNRVPIPLPPLAEQTRIVAEVERRLSVVEELEATVSANLQRATRLRQSILQKAFTGELA